MNCSIFPLFSSFLLKVLISFALVHSVQAVAISDSDFSKEYRNALLKDQEELSGFIRAIPKEKINYPYTKTGGTLLHLTIDYYRSVKKENLNVLLDELKDKGFDFNRKDNRGRAAISYLGKRKKDSYLFDLLVKFGVDLKTEDQLNNTLSHHYASVRSVELLKKLSDEGFLTDTKNKRGRSPLNLAVANGRLDSIKYLISKGADVSTVDLFGNNLLHIAASNSSINLYDFLLENGVKGVEQVNSDGETPLAIFARRNRWAEVRVLVERGGNLNVPLKRGGNLALLLYLHPEYGFDDVIDKDSIDLSITRENGVTNLSYYLGSGQLEKVNKLLELGDKPINNERNPLIYDVVRSTTIKKEDKQKVIQLLVDHGADPSQYAYSKDNYPLTAAVDDQQLFLFLMSVGSRPDFSNVYLTHALIRRKEYSLLLKLFEKHGTDEYMLNAFWQNIYSLAKDVVVEEKARSTTQDASELYLYLMKKKPVLDLSLDKSSYRSRLLENMSRMNSPTVLEGLNYVEYKNTLPSIKAANRQTYNQALVSKPRHSPIKSQSQSLSLSKEAKLHAVGVYGSSNTKQPVSVHSCNGLIKNSASSNEVLDCLSRTRNKHNKKPVGRVEVMVFTKEPVVLSLMAYESVDWVIRTQGSVKIEGVILSGYHKQNVMGLAPDIPILSHTYDKSTCSRCEAGAGYFYAYKRSSEEYDNAESKLMDITGKEISSFQGKYKARSFFIK
ncbi:ankyrin repeat domain-containing protein [Neptuniibacter sp. PT8_73]|uniref:ankyrin repeat domain-containing protein n=1 Tax=Neptuniibacter sp. PT8_73 TaxID=3398206 RepID=UPI0039F44CF2